MTTDIADIDRLLQYALAIVSFMGSSVPPARA